MSILLVGSTGLVGSHIVKAAKQQGIQLSVLVRPESVGKLKDTDGLDIRVGSLQDPSSLPAALQGIEIVISAVGAQNILDQIHLVKAAKEAGVKRFVPSDFGFALRPDTVFFAEKNAVHQAIIESGLEYTFVQSYGFFEYFAGNLLSVGSQPFPEAINLYGDGNIKVQLTGLEDVGNVTLLAVKDPRTANRTLVFDFAESTLTQNELVDLWEGLSGSKVTRNNVTLQSLVEKVNNSSGLAQVYALLERNTFVDGLATPSLGEGDVSASQLYPQYQYLSTRAYLERLLASKSS